MFYKITAHNTDALYAWSFNAADIQRYVDWLNRDREINVYSAQAVINADEIAQLETQGDVLNMDEPSWDDFMEDDIDQ